MKTYPEGNAYDIIQQGVEKGFHTFINKSPEDVKTVCIIGAYKGIEIFNFLKNYPLATIYAFEAYPGHFNALSDNFQDNPRVTLFNKAVAGSTGEIEFYQLNIEGNGSILPFQGDKFGSSANITEKIKIPSTTLLDEIGDIDIDLLWVDVQGAELEVLKGVGTKKCSSMFLEIHTHDFVKPWDKEPYKGQCYKEDLEEYLKGHHIHSIGLDNENKNGQGNSFWLRNDFKTSILL